MNAPQNPIEMDDAELVTFANRVASLVEATRILNGSETKVLLNIMALSAGRKPECVTLSLHDLEALTDLSEGAVRRALHALECRGMIRYTPHSNRTARTYSVDHDIVAMYAETIH